MKIGEKLHLMKHLGIQKSTRKLNPPKKKKILQPQATLPPLTPYNVMQEEKARIFQNF